MLAEKPRNGMTVQIFEDPITETKSEGFGIVIAETDIYDTIMEIRRDHNGYGIARWRGYFEIEFPPEPRTVYRFICWEIPYNLEER